VATSVGAARSSVHKTLILCRVSRGDPVVCPQEWDPRHGPRVTDLDRGDGHTPRCGPAGSPPAGALSVR